MFFIFMVVVVSYRREERYQNEFSFCFFLTMTSLSPKLSFEAAEKKPQPQPFRPRPFTSYDPKPQI